MSRLSRTPMTANGVEIVAGLRVWTNDMRKATVQSLDSAFQELNDEIWFDVVEDGKQHRTLCSETRCTTRHPGTGAKA